MKKVMALLTLFVVISPAFAENLDEDSQRTEASGSIQTEERRFERIIEAPDLESDQIYDLVIMWFSTTFSNPDNLINYKDSDSGLITGKLIYNFVFDYRSDLQINIRDNALRFRLSDTEKRRPALGRTKASSWSLLEDRSDLEGDEKLTAAYFDSLEEFIESNKDDSW